MKFDQSGLGGQLYPSPVNNSVYQQVKILLHLQVYALFNLKLRFDFECHYYEG